MHVPVTSTDIRFGLRGTRPDPPAPAGALPAGAHITSASSSSIAIAISAGRSSPAAIWLRGISLVHRRFASYSWGRSRHIDRWFWPRQRASRGPAARRLWGRHALTRPSERLRAATAALLRLAAARSVFVRAL